MQAFERLVENHMLTSDEGTFLEYAGNFDNYAIEHWSETSAYCPDSGG
jgi:hypothetical protein